MRKTAPLAAFVWFITCTEALNPKILPSRMMNSHGQDLSSSHNVHSRSSAPRPLLFYSDDVESSIVDMTYTKPNTGVKPRPNGIYSKLGRIVASAKADKAKIAKLGTTFALTYNFISNVNGSITLAISWFIASSKTGLSPLAPGQWKTLLSAYASIYALVTILKPFRIALAVGLCSKVESALKKVELRFDCSRGKAIAFMFSTGLVAWSGLATSGVFIASKLASVPIFQY